MLLAASGQGFVVPGPVVVLGLVAGSTYGILAVGLVLIYRTNRIINFAHGEIGAFGAAALGVAVVKYHVPYWVAFFPAMAISALVAVVVEVGVIRRLRNVPRLMSVIATLGFAQFLLAFQFVISGSARAGSRFPQPAGFPSFNVGKLIVSPAFTGMILLSPVLAAAIAAFLRFTKTGTAMRAAAANPDAARLAGIFSGRMSTLAWAIAGALSAFTAILIFPTQGFLAVDAFGPALLLRALAAAVIARMTNLPIALGAGLGIGMIERVLLWNYPSGGLIEMVLFAIILVALLLVPPAARRTEDQGTTWATVQTWRPVAKHLKRVWAIRNGPRLIGFIALAAALLVPVLGGFSASFGLLTIFAFSIVGVSLGVITGLAGQLSLGQFALAAIGATVSYYVSSTTGNFILGVLAGGAGAAVASIFVGIPALRIRGLMLAVTTLSFALMTKGWLLHQKWTLGEGVDPGRPRIAWIRFDTAKSYYYFALAFLILAVWLARNIRRGGLGRIMIALRDNEDGARAFTIAATTRKLQAFAIAGGLAGLGGAIYGHALARISSINFGVEFSIDVVAALVIGGVGILAGPLLGALYIFGIPQFIPLDSAGLAASAGGWLLFLLYFPGGIASSLNPLRERTLSWLARRAGVKPDADDVEIAAAHEEGLALTVPLAAESRAVPVARSNLKGEPLLVVNDVKKHFGGVAAVDGVSFELYEGETLGLIGPNGAGKTTLFELISGFIKPDGGTVFFDGHAMVRPMVTLRGWTFLHRNLRSEERASLGLVRSFQDAALFATMTVEEVIMLGLERSHPTPVFGSLVGSRESEIPKRRRAEELVSLMGLDPYRQKQVRELSTGTRRIAELAALIGLEPRLLLLDEPSSGIAQRESEALGGLLMSVKQYTHTTLLVIEHDVPLVMSISDRILALESGRIIASGPPGEVREDPRVVESYLGGDIAAIERSGKVAAAVAVSET